MRKLTICSALIILSSSQWAIALENCDNIDGWFDASKRAQCLYKNNLELQQQIAELKKDINQRIDDFMKKKPLVSGSKALFINADQSAGVKCLYKSGINTSYVVALEECKNHPIAETDIWIVESQ